MEGPKLKGSRSLPEPNPKQTMFISVIVAVLMAFPAGYIVGAELSENVVPVEVADNYEVEHGHDIDSKYEKENSDAHDMYEIPDGATVPSIDIGITADPKSGWNLKLLVNNFTFSPENAGLDHVEGEGHAHLYIDGVKTTRLYSADYYIGELSEGSHEIRVTLNTNDHKDYAVNGEVIESIEKIFDEHHLGENDVEPHSH